MPEQFKQARTEWPLQDAKKTNAPTFGRLLLAMPQDDGEFERARLPARPVDVRCS